VKQSTYMNPFLVVHRAHPLKSADIVIQHNGSLLLTRDYPCMLPFLQFSTQVLFHSGRCIFWKSDL